MTAKTGPCHWPAPSGRKSDSCRRKRPADDVRPVYIGAGDRFAPDFLEIAPNDHMPAIIAPDGPEGTPVSAFESGAIVRFLARRGGRFRGEDAPQPIAGRRNGHGGEEEWLSRQAGRRTAALRGRALAGKRRGDRRANRRAQEAAQEAAQEVPFRQGR